MAKEVWTDGNADSVAASSLEAYAQTIIFLWGTPTMPTPKYFIGQSYTAPVVTDGVPVVNVTFEPGCRNNWHVHKATKGMVRHSYAWAVAATIRNGAKSRWNCVRGCYQYSGRRETLARGTPDSWFSHLAIEVPGENNSTEWLEPVGDEEYSKLK